MHSADTNHGGSSNDAVTRLRRQFECGEPPRHDFLSPHVPEYAVFRSEQLSEELRQKLEKRKALGYGEPRAMTRDEIADWHRIAATRPGPYALRIRTAKKGSRKPSVAEKRAERELDKSLERERIAAETHRYGGPLRVPPRPVAKFVMNVGAIAMIVAGVSGFALIGALLGAAPDGNWGDVVKMGLVFLVSFAILVLTVAAPMDRSGDLTDTDVEEIDRAMEQISLPYEEYKEYRLVAYAAALSERIADSPAWASGYLADHRIELDYWQELRDITTHAYRLRAILLELGDSPRGDSPQAVRGRDDFEKASAPLAVVWLALVTRVAALESFTLHLGALDTQLATVEAVERATRLEGEIGSLFASVVSDEFAADHHTPSLTERSQDSVLSIEATLDALRRDIAGLTALSQSL